MRKPARRQTLALAAALLTAPCAGFAQGLPKLETTTPLFGGTEFRLYGQVNMGVLIYDDGGKTDVYAPVDNDNSSSRIGLRSTTAVSPGWTLRTNFEAEYQPNASNEVSQRDPHVDNYNLSEDNIRKLEASLSSVRYGTLTLGQGSMTTDGASEVDLSGTSVISYAAVESPAGGQFLRLSGGGLSTVTIGGAFDDFDGSRRARVRYDTPEFAGFTLSGAYGRNWLDETDNRDYYDTTLRYVAQHGDFQTAAAIGLGWKGSDSMMLSSSGSILHKPTGLNFTVTASGIDRDTGSDGRYLWGKVGLTRDFFPIGATSMTIDYGRGEDIATAGGVSTSVGIAAVQKITDWNLDLYALARVYSYDAPAASFDDGVAVMTGFRFAF